MKPGQIPIRLFVEILLILLVVEVGLMLAAPMLGGPYSPVAAALLDAVGLVLVSGPAVYWRCMHATRSAAALAREGARPDAGLTGRRGDRHEARRRHAVMVTAMANLGGLALTFGAVLATQSRLDTEARNQFERQFERLEREVLRRFRQPINGLKGARAVYASSVSVERAEFRAFVDARSLASDYPGVLGFGFIERVRREALDRFIAAERADEAPEFNVRTSGSAPELYVIKFIEPLAPNFSAWGYDVGSEPMRRAAVEAAIASGEPTLTGAIQLVQDAKVEPGYLYLMPIFRRGTDPVTAEQRRTALVGLVYTPIVAADLLAGASHAADGKLDFEVFDGDGADLRQLVHDADGHLRAARPGGGTRVDASRYEGRRIHGSHSLAVGGRLLTLRASTTPAFDAGLDRSPVAYVALGGAMLTFLLSLTVWSLAAGRVRALALAQQMTVELDRLAEVVRHTSNAVNITDRQLRIRWINEGFTRVTGFSAEDAIGKTPGELLGHPKASPATLARLAAAAAAGEACRVEILNRAKDGSDFWVDTEVQPIRDASGKVTGFMEIASDITEQRRAREALEDAQRENSALLRAIHAHAIVSVTDRTGRIIDVNDRFCRISGYPRDELIGQNHRLIKSDHRSTAQWREIWRTIAGGQPWHGEVCNRAKDGSLYWVDAVIVPFLDKDGRPEKYVSIRTDITAIKAASQQLARERQRLDNILRGTDVGTWEWHVDSGLNDVNERWAEMLGYALAELMPVTDEAWARLVQPEDLERARATLAQHLAGHREDYETEMRMRHKDGHWVWVHSRGRLVERAPDGSPLLVAGTHMDITLRKRAEEALRSTNERLRVILDNLPCGLSVFDAELQLVGSNEEFRHLLSLPAELFDRPVVTFESIIRHNAEHGEYGTADVEKTVAEIVERARHPVAHHFERTRPDGRVLEVRGAPLPGGGFVTTYTNITERKRAEAAVQEREHLLRLVTDNIPGRLTYVDNERRLKFANKASYAFYGGSPETSVGAMFEDFVGRPFATEQRPKIDLALAGQAQTYDFQRTRPDGQIAYSVVHLIPDVREGVVRGFIGMAIDVTPLRRAEQEVRRAEALLRGAIDTLNEAFALYDPQDRLVFCNDKYRELYAMSADLIVPGATFEHIIRVGAERGQYREAIGRVDEWVAERMVAHRAADRTLVQRIDDHRWIRTIERRMPDGHTVGFRIDVSDLMRATEAAEAASRSKSQFLANMSHEIRTPMNAILGMLKLLGNTELNARQRDYADKTERAARALLGLLNDILDFSKIEAGKLELDPRPFRLDRMMRDLSVILSANLGTKPVEVLFDIDPAVPRALVGDDLRLHQVLINLGGNAIKFTQAGEVVIGVRLLQRDGDQARVEFSVRDTGIGIAPAHQQHIFDSFSQAEASTTRRFGGTGLGLSISQRLVALMGGEMAIQSSPGQGSRFSFTLPMRVVEDAGGEHAGAVPPMRVLMVDDNPTARDVLATMAQSLGWQAELAERGEDAVAMVRRQVQAGQPYEAVFVDWQMPGLDGWETGQRIRALCGEDAPLLMMVTAHGRARLAERPAADQAMLSGYLVKPVTASMLLDAVVDARAARGEPHPSMAAALATGTLAGASVPRLQGLRLLVVEDNANNQQVAQELLEAEGAQVTLAGDGRKGVDAVLAANPPFDAVLMDIQMPVMDGYTATARLRERFAKGTLPIIAMTANAMASDRQACLAAGMDDHVGKPFDLDQLVDTLRRHVHRTPAAVDVAPPAATSAAAPSTPLPAPAGTPPAARRTPLTLPPALREEADARGIDLAGALARMSGRADILLRMAASFAESLPGRDDELRQRLQAGDREDAARQMHTLKGLAATLGATALSDLAAQAEKALDQPASRDDDAWPERLRAEARRTHEALSALIPALRTATAPPLGTPAAAPDRTALRQRLHALKAPLRDMDMAATDAFAELQQACGDDAPPSMTALGDAIAMLDFDTALAHCATLEAAWTS